MSFKILSLVLALMCLTKGIVALTIPTRFYERRQRQYASERIPGIVLLMSAILIGLLALVWYATWFHYVRWGWVVTGFVTSVSLLSLDNVFRWSKHRARMLRVIEFAQRTRYVDGCIVALGIAFLLLSIFVYPS